MNVVQLRVNVVGREQVSNLVSQVASLRNTTINIKATATTGAARRDVANLGDTINHTSKQADSLFANMKKFTTWYLIGGVISGVTRNFSDALKMMKAVDDELVVVRKVSKLTTNELKALEKQAYATASAYGVAADKFLSSVSAFSRAGYGKLAEQLAELSVKTQLVGDTDADTANQFLLSVDAAYQYRGEVEKLNKVLDGANEIDNKYATSIQKIAEGIGIVAPVAKQAHMEIDELTAAVGTITAVTQRSGSEAARALRALILNIVGDTKTEIDEGVTWTTGEIAGLQEVIRLYANDAYEAAKATGSIINPMEAIAGLAKSMKEGLLTEQELMSMVSDIGGKLRTSQLLALIQNWDMYQSMLTDYGKAIGSADREVANALDSWTRKSEILNNKWTAFVSNIVDTEVVKGGLDVLIGFIDLLDTGIGRAVVTSVAFGGAAVGVVTGVKAITAAMTALNVATLANPIFLGTAGAAIAVAGFATLVDSLNVSYEEQVEIVSGLNSEFEAMFGYGSEYETLKSHEEDLLDVEKERLKTLEAIREQKEWELKQAKKQEFEKWQEEQGVGVIKTGLGVWLPGAPVHEVGQGLDNKAFADASKRLEEARRQYAAGKISAQEYVEALRQVIADHSEYNEKLTEYIDLGFEVTEAQKWFAGTIKAIYGEIDRAQAAIDRYNQSEDETTQKTDEANKRIQALAESTEKYQAIAYDYGTTSRMTDTVDALKERIRLYREMSSVVDTATNSEEESTNTTDKKLEALQEVVALRESELTLLERQEASSNGQVSKIKEIQTAIKDQIDYMTSIGASQTEINNLTAEWYQWQGKIKDLLESDSEALAKYQADLWRELENAINSTIEKTDKERDAKLNSLDAQLDKAQQLRDAQLEALDSQLEAQKLLHDNQMSALDAQLEALQNERDAKDDQLALEERILAVQEAQAALANAQAQRTVRYFNAATGAWEWGANAKNVKDAQEALKNAQKDLSDFRDNLAYNEAIRAIEDKKTAIQTAYDFIVAEIKNRQNSIDAQYDATERDIKRQKSQINTAYDALTSQWQMIGASMEVPARSITDILNDIATYGTPQMKMQIDNVNVLLAKLGLYLKDFLGVEDTGNLGLDLMPGGITTGGTVGGSTGSSANLTEVARQVIQGYWGNGSARRNALAQAGFDYDEVMAIVNSMLASGVYDSGGILKGLGGIKATKEDEIVLPPDITKAMLSPSADSKFNARLSELHYLYGIGGNRPQSISEGVATKYGDQHNGDVYNYGDITLTENQAKSMSVYDLARLSGNLNIYSDK